MTLSPDPTRPADAAGGASATVERVRPDDGPPAIVLCDHAGRLIPPGLDLGVGAGDLGRHIAYDIGAARVTRGLARGLGVGALLCHVSRLVIDPNRRPGRLSSIPAVSDGTRVPGNAGLDHGARRARIAHGFLPYHRAIARTVAGFRRRGVVPAIVSVHSFTPRLEAVGAERPWEIGVLWNRDGRVASPLIEALAREPGLIVGDNEPYSGRTALGYTVPFHAEARGLPHVTLEIRQDAIDTDRGADLWARRLTTALRPILAADSLYRLAPRGGRTGDAR